MARSETNEPNRLIAASVGAAVPSDPNTYGYLSEHHSHGETAKKAGDYAEDLEATMLATTLALQKSAEGNKDSLWTTVIACAVLIE